MPLVPTTMETAFIASLAAKGFAGTAMPAFAKAIAEGTVLTLAGKSFNTFDTGSGTGSGVGAGVGLTGVSAASIAQGIHAACIEKFGQAGPQLLDFAESYGDALVALLQTATLTSAHSPVIVGSGQIIQGSIIIQASEWASNIDLIGKSLGLAGEDLLKHSEVIAQGSINSFSTLTGQVTISGAGTPAPVPPAPNTIIPAGIIS